MAIFFVNKENKNFNIFHQNIQSIRPKISEIEMYLSSEIHDAIDVLCFSETFLKGNSHLSIQIDGYELAEHFTRKNISRGGVCIFVKKNITYNRLEWLHDLSIEENFECCGINIPELKTTILCIYRSGKNLNIFLEKLEILLYKLTRKERNRRNKIVLTGDFNIDLLKDDNKSKQFKQILNSFKLNNTIVTATRITINTQTCIDNIFTNFRGYKAGVLNLGLSDHTAQILQFPCSLSYKEKFWYVYKRKVDNNLHVFMKYISQLSFAAVYQQLQPNAAYNVFIDMFKMVYDLCFPLERCKVTFKKKPNWKTKGISKSCKSKRQYYIDLQKDRSKSKVENYKKYKRILKTTIRYSKRKTNINYIKKSTNKSKATWGLINQYTKNTNEIQTSINNLKLDKGVLNDKLDIAEFLNNLYITQNANDDFIDQYRPSYSMETKSIYLKPVDVSEITSIVKKLKNKKSYGDDGISVQVIKACIDHISLPLVHITNLMLETGCFPDKLKTSIIKPLHKKGPKDEPNNYRPIALLPCFSKIFEKVIYNRLTEFLDKYNILNKNQFGFRKDSSTSLAIYAFLSNLWEAINAKKDCTGLFIDMSKAFDCVVHSIVLKQLDQVGIRGVANDLIKSYLDNRKQALMLTKFNEVSKSMEEVKSTYKTIKIGVPQGSVLGPLLFLIYVNELPNLTRHLCIMFADDATLLFVKNDLDIAQYKTEITNTLETMTAWLESINLKVNLTKTKLVQFRNYKKKDLDIDIIYKNTFIEEVTDIGFLGVHIDKHLNWAKHIEKLNNKISSYCYALSVLVDVSSIEVAINAYYGNVYPLLLYGILFWGNSVDVKKAFVMQKRCLRIIFNKPNEESLRTTFKEKGFLTVTGIFILEICLFVRRNKNKFKKVSDQHNVNVRDKDRLVLPTIKCMIYDKSTFVTAIRIYNKLPNDIKHAADKEFKKVLKKWLIGNVFYDLNEFYDR